MVGSGKQNWNVELRQFTCISMGLAFGVMRPCDREINEKHALLVNSDPGYSLQSGIRKMIVLKPQFRRIFVICTAEVIRATLKVI